MKKSTAIRARLLGIAVLGGIAGPAHAAETLPGVDAASDAARLAQAERPAPADPATQSATPVTLSQASTLTAPLSPPAQVSAPTSWNDTYIGYRVGTNFYYPGVRTATGAPAKVTQNIGFLTTTGGFRYGSYAFNVDYLVSNMANPEAGPTNQYGYPTPGSGGAQEVYSVGRVSLSASRIFNRQFSYGFIRDVGLTLGYEFGTKNDAYAERARMFVAGPTIEFAIPRGFWNMTLGVRTESNHDGITNVDVHFNPAVHFEFVALSVPSRPGPAGVQRLRERDGAEGERWLRRAHDHRVSHARLSHGGRRIVRRPSAHDLCGHRLRVLAQHVWHAGFGTTGDHADIGADVRRGTSFLIRVQPRSDAVIRLDEQHGTHDAQTSCRFSRRDVGCTDAACPCPVVSDALWRHR